MMWISFYNSSMVENSKWWVDYVLANEDNSIQNPLEKAADVNVIQFNIGYVSLALPINSYVAFIILSTPSLRNQFQYVIMLYDIVSNLFSILNDVEETVFYFWPSEELCQTYVSTIGLSHIILLYNTFLVLLDRLLAITQLQFYCRMLTPLVVNLFPFITTFLLVLLIDWVFLFGVAPIRCAYNPIHVSTLVGTGCVLFVVCCILFILIRIKTRPNPSVNEPHQEEELEQTKSTIEAVADALDLLEEKKWTRKYVTAFIAILYIPYVITIITSLPSFICIQFYPADSSTCSPLVLMASYETKFSSLNTIISPWIVICSRPQFYSPLINCLKRFVRLQPRDHPVDV